MTYIVKRGDTLYGISNQFGVSVTELARINNVDASNLQIGQVLQIPSDSGVNPDNMFLYTVVSGDTLYSIAKKYNTTVSQILDLNHLTKTNLSVGQVIRIPEVYTPVEDISLPQYQNYVVQKGDSIYSISKMFQIDVEVLRKDNSLTSDVLYPGQNLKIRVLNYDVEECFGTDYNLPVIDQYINYTVNRGDTLYSIAKKYNTSVSDLININKLDNSNLVIGQIIKVPSSNSKVTYTVQKGDTLYSIAKKYQTTVDSIVSNNNLNTPNLSIGQVLQI